MTVYSIRSGNRMCTGYPLHSGSPQRLYKFSLCCVRGVATSPFHGGVQGIRFIVTADGARAEFPDDSSIDIPVQLLERSSTLSDALSSRCSAAQQVFTLVAPSEWLHAWIRCTAVLMSPSPSLNNWDMSQMSLCLLVRAIASIFV